MAEINVNQLDQDTHLFMVFTIPQETCHLPCFHHSFATYLLENSRGIRTVRGFFGHEEVRTTMIDAHVLDCGPSGVRSPMDLL